MVQTFFVDEDIKEACVLDAVLTVVDTKHITQHLDEVKPEGVVNEAGKGMLTLFPCFHVRVC
jgi:G3E family GTPase